MTKRLLVYSLSSLLKPFKEKALLQMNTRDATGVKICSLTEETSAKIFSTGSKVNRARE